MHDKLILFDKMAFNQISQPSFALEYRLYGAFGKRKAGEMLVAQRV